MEYICILIILIILIFMTVASYCNLSIDRIAFKKIWKLVIVLAFIMAFIFEPNGKFDWDLIRIYARLDDIRFLGLDNALTYSDLEKLYIFKWWMYFVSLTDFNGLLTAVPFAIDVWIFGYIISDIICRKYNGVINFRYLCMAMLLWWSLIGVKLAVSDIRCVFAMSVCSFALYNEFIINKNKVISFFLYVLALFTHHYTVVFIGIRVLVGLFKKIKDRNLFIVASLLLFIMPFAIELFIVSLADNSYYFNIIYDKLLGSYNRSYFFEREFTAKILYVSMVSVLLFSIIWSFKNIKYREDGNNKLFDNANLALYVSSVFGCSFFHNYLIVEREMYIISFLLSINYLLATKVSKSRVCFIFIIPLLMYILFINDINAFIMNKLGYVYLKVNNIF